MALGTQAAALGGATKTLIVALDPGGNIAPGHVIVNAAGTEIGTAANPIQVALPGVTQVSLASVPLAANAAQDGADASGVTAPAGGSGIRGWLSGIYAKLSGTLNVAFSGALPAGTNSIGAVTVAALPLPAGAATSAKQDGIVAALQPGNIATGQVSVGSAATLIVAARAGRKSVAITQEGTNFVRLGPSGVTLATGAALPGVMYAERSIDGGAAVYGIVASGNSPVSFIEVY